MKPLTHLLISSCLIFATPAFAQFTAGRVVVLQMGSVGNSGNPGFLNEYLPATAGQATPSYQVTLPNSGATPTPTSIVFGTSSSLNHNISLSSDGAW